MDKATTATDLVAKFGATEFESICLGAPDLQMGITFLYEKTGLRAVEMPVVAGQWSCSAVLQMTSGAVLEVLAPNPAFRGVHHFGAELAQLSEPELVFWTLKVTDFEQAAQVVAALDHPIEAVQENEVDEGGFKQALKIGRLGPGENMIRPVLSFAKEPAVYPEMPDPQCSATALHLSDWNAPPLTRLLSGLGSELRVVGGAPSMRLELDTPNGQVTLEGGTWIKGGIGQTVRRLGRELRHLFRRRRT